MRGGEVMAETEVFKPDSTGPTATAMRSATNALAKAADQVAEPPIKPVTALVPEPKTHKMVEGDELWRIATQNGVSLGELVERNRLWNLAVSPGVIIQLP